MNYHKKIGIYPGSFDPLTNGHWDIIVRATQYICDSLIIAVATNITKTSLFDKEERVNLIQQSINSLNEDMRTRITVQTVDSLLVDFCQHHHAHIIVRGIRAFSDFDSEFQMSGMNAKLNRDIQTIFLTAHEEHQFISSRLIKEIIALGGDIHPYVPKHIAEAMQKKFNQKSSMGN